MVSRLGFSVIDTHDFKSIGILDTSWYNPDIAIQDSKIEILPPGYNLAASPFFMAKALNVYNSNGIGLTHASCADELEDLPDGIWKIKYSICPNETLHVEKFFLKTDKLICRYINAFLSIDLQRMDSITEIQKRNKLENIEMYIEGANAAANNQNAKLAIDFYNKASKLLDAFIKSNNIGCPC